MSICTTRSSKARASRRSRARNAAACWVVAGEVVLRLRRTLRRARGSDLHGIAGTYEVLMRKRGVAGASGKDCRVDRVLSEQLPRGMAFQHSLCPIMVSGVEQGVDQRVAYVRQRVRDAFWRQSLRKRPRQPPTSPLAARWRITSAVSVADALFASQAASTRRNASSGSPSVRKCNASRNAESAAYSGWGGQRDLEEGTLGVEVEAWCRRPICPHRVKGSSVSQSAVPRPSRGLSRTPRSAGFAPVQQVVWRPPSRW